MGTKAFLKGWNSRFFVNNCKFPCSLIWIHSLTADPNPQLNADQDPGDPKLMRINLQFPHFIKDLFRISALVFAEQIK